METLRLMLMLKFNNLQFAHLIGEANKIKA